MLLVYLTNFIESTYISAVERFANIISIAATENISVSFEPVEILYCLARPAQLRKQLSHKFDQNAPTNGQYAITIFLHDTRIKRYVHCSERTGVIHVVIPIEIEGTY